MAIGPSLVLVLTLGVLADVFLTAVIAVGPYQVLMGLLSHNASVWPNTKSWQSLGLSCH